MAPSLLGIYDILTNSLDTHKSPDAEKTKILSNNTSNHHTDSLKKQETESSNNYYYEIHSNYKSTDNKTNTQNVSQHNSADVQDILNCVNTQNCISSNNANNKHRQNIRVLSSNVQRIINHSEAEPIHAVNLEALHKKSQSPHLSPISQHRLANKSACSLNNASPHKVKPTHIPLSKITNKLTQSGSDLVDTFDSSEYNEDLNSYSNRLQSKYAQGGSSCIDLLYEKNQDALDGNALTHSGKPNRLKQTKQYSQEFIEKEQIASSEQQTKLKPYSAQEYLNVKNSSSEEFAEAINFKLISQNIQKLTFGTIENCSRNSTELIEAINKPLISKSPFNRSSSADVSRATNSSPLHTYARSKSLALKANTIGATSALKVPTEQELEALEESSKMSAESLDRLTDIKTSFSTKDLRKANGLMLPDIMKLKHRPLSSSSICSTSSSSSSGSEHLNAKLTTSYLASVESLADQSETELVDPHTGLSVFERSCLEIVDSERSYVEDLGQVVRG